jgi:uncharacterized protein HemX
MTTILTAALWLLLPALVLGAIVAWVLETRTDRIRRWHQAGASQAAIARRLGISRYQVRKALAC